MPMSSKDHPAAEKPAKKATPKAEPKPEPKAGDPQLAKASTSGHPDVQRLLAIREIALSGGDEVKVADMDAQLAELGFTAE